MKIYTKRGDDGDTDLRTMDRVSKASPRIEAYGTVDELNAAVGAIRPTDIADLDAWLREAQNHLHVVQADFANPEPEPDDPQITAEHVTHVEKWIDHCEARLDPLESFILPGGSEAGAALHQARAVCRRAERRAVALQDHEPDDAVNDTAVAYLNRLSDALFVFARLANDVAGVHEESPSY
ncbi:cob(I)yrinic acid a,c-diamide adenosyltransferase [Halobacterium salinarum]|uniref:ATP:cob(I)alamin adenosyltransferase n=4 Tax=Halobacterium salinarum TaxID=2242 RepID=A0A510N743_HALSA|nr:cob(I)yrinic acid a,c-diamide adenosyltransferase [Halobacterium salinarum]MBB6088836.1 cob(I)alamin adenosyltransferase [Halobacterium salinarum]MDL0119482.1 cob(I)yrinic acid a,c-diamide adenosyltransferase [Halobacterium salinarum]MDL0142225.1 cob(I)yrinic acid a,c-diamide adenosyltransferase [Halobacterium salinarum]UEB91186.1 cob(I)yrinic acid a,c-diamide adenosyltransferase [Halobacterium salinarum NRC-34001]CAP14116.1 ATP:cob(I)alamin adenosyltransferase [Halobacterium salinarum R1]